MLILLILVEIFQSGPKLVDRQTYKHTFISHSGPDLTVLKNKKMFVVELQGNRTEFVYEMAKVI